MGAVPNVDRWVLVEWLVQIRSLLPSLLWTNLSE